MKTLSVISESHNGVVNAKCPSCKESIAISPDESESANTGIEINRDDGHLWPSFIVCMNNRCDFADNSKLKF